jgi:Phosphotriesterase family/Recombinase zinc beta ribbon domain/Recombinase
MAQVETVRGPVDVESMGPVLMHEHLFTLGTEIRHKLSGVPDPWDEDHRVADAVAKLRECASHGIRTIVDPTVLGLGRFIPRVQRINEQVDINIVVATGIYTYHDEPMQFPWRHLKGPRKGEICWKPLAHHAVLRVLHNPRYAGCLTYGRHRYQALPAGQGGKEIRRLQLPREEWISFIPGAHPGYITVEQYDANLARLAANAAAHGRDRRSGPPREGPALLQGIIICGRCGLRMTIRYHHRRGQQIPTYMCQRDGIENGRPACAAIPGGDLDQAIGQLLLGTLTPLAVEAALQVSAELEHRAAEADALRAAHIERAQYHADLARRRYLAVDPADRLVAGTLEADWNTALRALGDAQETHDRARREHAAQLTDAQKSRIGQLVTDLPAI